MSVSTDDELADDYELAKQILKDMNSMIQKYQSNGMDISDFQIDFSTQNKIFEKTIGDIVISKIRQDYDTSKIFLNNWIVKIRDGNLETINYDARLHYMDNEYITGSSLYNSLYNSLYKLHKNEPVDADSTETDGMAITTEDDKTILNVKLPKAVPTRVQTAVQINGGINGGAEISTYSQNSFGEEFMPESYYEKQKSELIIEYLVFLSEKSFYLFKQTCTIFIKVIIKVLKEFMKLSLSVVGSLIKAAFIALFQFIFQNYLDPIYELLKNLNPFKIPFEKPFENNENKIEEEIDKLKNDIDEIKTEIEDVKRSQGDIKSIENQNNYFWIADQLLKAATGPILLAIKHHAAQGLIARDAHAAILGN